MVGKYSLSENQFGLRKGKSTVGAIQAVVNTATKSTRGTDKRKGFCAFVSIDIRNTCMTISCVWTYLRYFADDALVIYAAEDVGILELRTNESLWWAKSWLDSRGLQMAPKKTEALLVMDRRSFEHPKIVLGEHKVVWKKSNKHLGERIDWRLMLLRSGQVPLTTMLFRKSCLRHREVSRWK